MRFVFRSLLFAAGFLIGGEALRRWLEKEQAERPAGPAPHLRAVPSPERQSSAPKPAPAAARADRDASQMSKVELYERAKQLDIKGRSKMSKAALAAAVARAEAGA